MKIHYLSHWLHVFTTHEKIFAPRAKIFVNKNAFQ